jgi:hypothetical protein
MAEKSGPTSESLSQQYRARAEQCRTRAQTFRDPKARARMLDVAAEYERKALRAETLEAPKTNKTD